MPRRKGGAAVISREFFLLVPAIYLMIIGLILHVSLAQAKGAGFSLSSQLIASSLALLAMGVAARQSKTVVIKASLWAYGLAVIGLVAVLVAGESVNGATRWLQLGPVQFQPSELAKLALIVLVARLASRQADASADLRLISKLLVFAGLLFVLVVMQPDLSTALVFLVIACAMILARGLQLRLVLLLATIGVLLLAAMLPLLAGYQQQRIDSFLQPNADPLGAGYNVLQSTIAIGSGGWLGNGLRAGSQSQYRFLPSAETDFIFAVTAEKLGFVGAISVMLALLLLIVQAIALAWTAPDQYSRALAAGFAALVGFQSIVNIGMNLGLLPVTGLPLPFVSFGGTHILVEATLLGLLLQKK